MKLKVKVDGESGQGYVAAIDPASGEHRKAVTVGKGQEVELEIAEITSADQIGFGNVVDSESGETVEETPGSDTPSEPADTPGGGNEGAPAGESGGETPGGNAGAASGEQGGGEAPTTSAASEKPLYLVDADTIPEGFTASGLETPDGKTLFHFGSDTAGQSATGNVDGVSVYADADDNEKPVQKVAETA